MTAEILTAALALARQGYRVFPTNGKRPWPGFRWADQATTDPDTLRALWDRWPTSNLAIATGEQPDGSHLIVIDIDGDIPDIRFPDDCQVYTGRGRHIYLRSDQSMGNATAVAELPLDIRGTGGYVIAPPSMHASGERYTWDGGPEGMADAPQWLWTLVDGAKPEPGQPISEMVMEGGRDDYLANYAGRMRHFGASPDEIIAALTVVNAHRCLPPLRDSDIARIANSIGRYQPTVTIPTEPTPCLTWQDIQAPLAPKKWLCRDLGIARGRPYMISGFSGVGKTWFAMDLILSLSAGRGHAWGGAPLDTYGPCVHLDYEMGAETCRERYQQIALGYDDPPEPDLALYPFPRTRLTDPDAYDSLCRTVDGSVACLLDNLRAACPGVDENDSRIAEYVYKLNEVTAATGCQFIIIHHENKPSAGRGNSPQYRLRGSSAIHGALGGAISLQPPSDDGWLTADCAKSAHGRPHVPLELALDLSPDPNPVTGNSRAVRVVSANPWNPPVALGPVARRWAAVRAELSRSPRPSTAEICATLGGDPAQIRQMINLTVSYYSGPPSGARCETATELH